MTTLHKDVTERLAPINARLCEEVRQVLEQNKSQRHIRGGIATKEKYARQRKRVFSARLG